MGGWPRGRPFFEAAVWLVVQLLSPLLLPYAPRHHSAAKVRPHVQPTFQKGMAELSCGGTPAQIGHSGCFRQGGHTQHASQALQVRWTLGCCAE